MTIFADDIADVLDTIAESGQPVTIQHIVPGTVDAVTDKATPDQPQNFDTSAVIIAPRRRTVQAYANEFANGTLTLANARDVLVGQLGFTPQPGDRVIVPAGTDAGTWAVYACVTLAPDGADILSTITVKR